MLDSYDIVLSSCGADSSLTARLGYRGLGIVGKGISRIDANDPHGKDDIAERSIAFGSNYGNLSSLVRKGVMAVCVDGFQIDRKLMEDMAHNDCILCIGTKEITNTYGIRRPRALYRASKLFRLAKKRGIRVSFATLASSAEEMLSKIQLIEIAKLVGAEEQYARYSISEINGYVVGADD